MSHPKARFNFESALFIKLQNGVNQPGYRIGFGGDVDIKAQLCCSVGRNRADAGDGDALDQLSEVFCRQQRFEIFDR